MPFMPFLSLLAEIDDPRRAEGKMYGLAHVVLFAILAMVAGANSYRSIHSFIDVHLVHLLKFFGLNWRRAPAYSSIRIILRQLDVASVEQVFRRHSAVLHERSAPQRQCHVAVDGKALRLSFDNFQDRKAAHMLSAFASDTALVLAHLDCDEKSNEIPAVQALLRQLGLDRVLLTADAMHCQKKTFEEAATAGALLIAQVKDNQPTLHQRIAQVCETATPVDQDTSTDTKRRSRDETRVVEVFDPDAALAGTEWADHVGAIVRVSRTTHKRVTATGLWDTSIEVAYFVCEFLLPAATCAHAIRHHWGIENRSHYVRDGSFREDHSRIRCNPGIFARLRSFAANILRFNKIENITDARYRISLGGLDALAALQFM